MSRRTLLPAAALLGVLLLWSLPAAAVNAGDIEVTIEQQQPPTSPHGYTEYRFLVTNRSRHRQHLVDLIMPADYSQTYGPSIATLRRSVTVAPGSAVTVSLFQHPLPLQGSNLLIEVDDGEKRQRLPLALSSATSFHPSHQPGVVLASAWIRPDDLPQELRDNATLLTPYGERWPTSWLALSRFDLIIIDAIDLAGQPDEVRAALLAYIRCGGTLVVLGGAPLPFPELLLVPHESGVEYTMSQAGFGRCLVSEAPSIAEVTGWEAISSQRKASLDPWAQLQTSYSNNDDFPVVTGLGVPIRGLFLLMIGFAVVIGPVNLILLKRRQRQIWLLVTVPAIAALTSLIILVSALLSEGITATVRMDGLTVLDQTSGRATTIGRLAYYAPLTPRAGLHFPADVELTPMLTWGYSSSGIGRVVDWSSDQHLVSGWIRARVPSHFLWRSDCYRRERLVLRAGPGGGPEVVNGLGADITQLWLVDHSGRRYQVSGLAAGTAAPLIPESESGPLPSSPWVLRELYQSPWHELSGTATVRIRQLLVNDSYLAVLAETPFITTGLPSYRQHELSSGVVYGLLGNSVESVSQEAAHAG